MFDWSVDAECQDLPTEIFFSEGMGSGNEREVGMVKEICSRCPVRRKCLDTALQLEQFSGRNRHGIWGGLSPRERTRLWTEIKYKLEVEVCKNGHLMDQQNVYINPGGYRQCRKCKTRQRSEWRMKQKLMR